MKKRVCAIVLSLIMVLTLLPATALAADVTVTVGGVELTSADSVPVYATTNSDGAVTTDGASADNYNVKWDGTTLTLRNATINGGNGVGVQIGTGNSSFTLMLSGTNTVSTADSSSADAVYINGSITIQQEDAGGSLVATAYGAGNGINSTIGLGITSGTVTGEAKGSGHGVASAQNLVVYGGSLSGISSSGNGVNVTNSIQHHDPGGGIVRGESESGSGVAAKEVAFYNFGTLIASGGTAATSITGGVISISPFVGLPTANPDWCTVTASDNTDGSSPKSNRGGEITTETGIPYKYATAIGNKYLKIAPYKAEPELALTVTATGSSATPDTDYTYDLEEKKLQINKSGAYTLKMAPNVTTTAHQVEIIADGVELTLDNVKIETTSGTALKSNNAADTIGNTIKLNGESILTAGGDALGLAVFGKLTIADGAGDGTGSLTATGSNMGAGIGVSDANEGMELTISGGTVTANGGKDSNGKYQGPGIGSMYIAKSSDKVKPISVIITGGEVWAEGSGGIATSSDSADENVYPAQITVIISGGDVTGKATGTHCGIGGAKARVEISGGTVVGECGTVCANSQVAVGAGIGGTCHTRDDTKEPGVFISGGIVAATGGTINANNVMDYGGAGIGGVLCQGIPSQTAKVVISGGTVTATGGHHAAGIGGSSKDTTYVGGKANVTISGGTVTATGGEGGRAIGGGYQVDDDTVVSIEPGSDKTLLLKFADAPASDWSGVTDSVRVDPNSTLDYKNDTHYSKLCAHISIPSALTGTVGITGEAKYGETLTADITDTNNTGTLSYQWKRGETNIGTNSKNYISVAADIDATVTCIVSSSIETGTRSASSDSIGKADGPAVTGVIKSNCTTPANDNGTLENVTVDMEYKISTEGAWTDGDGNLISGLGNGTYYIRVKETPTHNAGAQSSFVIAAYTAPSTGGGSALPPTYNVPVESSAGRVNISTTVSGGTASIIATDVQLSQIISNEATGTVKLDVSTLTVNEAVIPAKLVAAAAAAAGTEGLEVAFSAGSVTLDKTALTSVGSKSINLSVETVKPTELAAAQRAILGSQADKARIVDVNILADGAVISEFNGGVITITVPYTPEADEDISKLVVWYLADDGSIEPMNGRYNSAAKSFEFTTTHLSTYVLTSFPFADVATDSYYYSAVAWAVAGGVTEGTGDTTFSPADSCTRAQMVTFLWRAMGSPEPERTTCPFTDVSADAYYCKAVLWAAEKGITEGTSATAFSPDDIVNRAQVVTLQWRAAGRPDAAAGSSFTDVASGAYYEDAVLWAVAQNITEGTSAATFSPVEPCTRAQIVTFLCRCLAK